MIDSQRLKRLLQRLIDIYSPSGKEEDILSYLKGFLKRKGIEAQLQDVDENRHNLIIAPRNADIQLALIGHLDTVTAYDLDHYMYSEKEDEIFGLGAADMKGGCAAMIEAFLSLIVDQDMKNLPFALCLVVGEEETGDGAAQLMKEYRFPWALIGEPTDLVPCFQSYGYVESQINTVGKRQHASLAGRKKNSVESLLGGLLRFTTHMELKRPDLIYNIRDLFTPPAGFAVPEYCEAWIDMHLPPEASVGEIITEIEEVVSRQNDPADIEVRFRTETIDAGYDLPEKGPMKEILKSVYADHAMPWSTNAFRSHSDANQMFSSGVKPIILGPGQLEKAHAQDESISFAQVVKAAEIYHDFMKKILAS